MKNRVFFFLIFVLIILLSSCGEGIVDIGSQNYEPKIVIEGYLFPDSKPQSIKICRNFPLNTNIDSNRIFIPDVLAKIVDITNGMEYPLQYNLMKRTYEYAGNDFKIGYNKTYKLVVSAKIDGKLLSTSSTTTTPQKGLEIDRTKSILNDLKYRERDTNGDLKLYRVNYKASPGTEFYAIAVTAVNASMSSFIYDNPVFSDSAVIFKHLNEIANLYLWQQNVQGNTKEFQQDIGWMNIWFYGRYQVIVYAGDQNFKDFLLTHEMVMEMDGNLHEPRFHFEGDGIGIFGSAIADTVYFNVLK